MSRDLDLDRLADEPRTLTLGGRVYPIPDVLTVPMLARFVKVRRAIDAARTDDQYVEAFNGAHAAVLAYVQVATPDARFELTPRQIVAAIDFIVGNADGPEAELVEGLQDGAELQEGDEGEAAPLRPARRSRRRSSRSRASSPSSPGGPATGARSSGATSDSSSPTPTGV